MHAALAIAAIGVAAVSLPAQLAGTYLINPAGGPPNYTSFQNAVNAAAAAGVSGPVVFEVLPGTYTESVVVPPITGTSATNTITFRPLAGPGTVQLNGSSGDTFALQATAATAMLSDLVFDGLDFVSAPGQAITGTRYVEAIEIRNCTFGPNHRGATRDAILYAENYGTERGWNVHHNRFTFPGRQSRTAYGIYCQNVGDWSIHDNSFDLNGCDFGLYLINQNRRLDVVYNNLFFGSLFASTSTSINSVAVIRADVSNYDNDFVHNTFFVSMPGTAGCILVTRGLSGGNATNRLFGNVMVINGPGSCVVVNPHSSLANPYIGDGNLFWAPAGEIGRITLTGTPITTLAAWQTATGMDAGSAQADPLFVAAAALPPDLHVLPNSPAKDLGVNTPAYVDHDFDGRLRDARADAGAYEGAGFAVYGSGCPGTASNVPQMGSSGTVALGSVNFSIDLHNALPNVLTLLAGGFSRTTYNSVPLPLPIGGGCEVLAAPQLLLFTVSDAGGAATIPLPIPNLPGLTGFEIYWQWAVLDPAAPNAFGVALSNGGALQL